ncbi:PKD domain-containing protein [Streptomyces sp. NPDC058289]|uniref:PKD domain-containing protein n=1 Tax=Streptomyces sp. NPDC058289 TaxID=3346425 RepID=UPI0036F0B823
MRPTRRTALLTAGLVTLLGLPATAAAAADPADLYVNSAAGSHCSDGGTGTKAVPFCSISAAAKVVKPGQTVRIAPETGYPGAVTIDRSGEPGKPITFAFGEEGVIGWQASIEKDLTISGASHVVVRGLAVGGAVRIDASHDVTLEKLDVFGPQSAALVVGGASTDVRVIRSMLGAVRIEGGAQRTVLSRNVLDDDRRPAVTVLDAPGTALTNNTVRGGCGAAVSLGGTSTGSALFNNVVHTRNTSTTCAVTEPRIGIAVAKSATAGTRVDYNIVAGQPGTVASPYNWAGTAYQTVAAFLAAGGQGAHDLLRPSVDGIGAWDGSPTVDSGDPTAPGVIPLDWVGNPIADDPRVPNTGKGGGYIDRGAEETQDDLRGVTLSLSDSWAPVGTRVKATAAADSYWSAALTYHFDFGDGTDPVVTKQPTVEHVYSAPGGYGAMVKAVNGVGKRVWSTYTPVKVTPAGPLKAAFAVDQPLPTSSDPDVMGIVPLTVVIDPTELTAAPWPVVSASVEFGDGNTAHADELRSFEHSYSSPGNYTMKLTLVDSKGAKSTALRTVKVDYAPSGYVATEPFRIKDSRTDGRPVLARLPLDVTLPTAHRIPGHPLSAGLASAVVNVTVTGATEDTHLTVWPSGQPRPATSNVNVAKGGTSSNTVTVPAGGLGSIQAQLGSGEASLIVDFVGYYQPNIGQRFSPLAPTRVLDTRTTGGALGGGKTRTVKVAGVNGIPADATAVALNLTGTGAKEQAHVIAYPDPAKRPATSNLNVEPGKDKSNQAIVPVGPNGTITLFTNSGSTHLVLDAVGYYGKDGKALFTPVVPKRLADTRTTGKVAPGATTTVSGLPANALGAVLNITATDTTAPGFLTAYGYGGKLPGASSLNTLPGLTVPNHVTTPVGTGGKVNIFNSYGGPNHVITDLLGYFTTG